jgi:hypothetical protein
VARVKTHVAALTDMLDEAVSVSSGSGNVIM